MNVLLVDDERLAIENLTALLKVVVPEEEIASFTDAGEALDYVRREHVDVALLDIEMGEMNGIAFAKECKEICPTMNIIFVTGYDQYTMDALRLHASGYLLKPVREKDLQAELENLRHPLPIQNISRVKIQTFGNFEIFVNQKPLNMPIAKCRECLAYLIDRKGARVTVAEVAAILWEDSPYGRRVQNNTHRVISDMMKCLKVAGISEIMIKNRKEMAIDPEMVDCDYYRFLRGDVSQINTFRGEYMSNYSWAEFTLAQLEYTKKIK